MYMYVRQKIFVPTFASVRRVYFTAVAHTRETFLTVSNKIYDPL